MPPSAKLKLENMVTTVPQVPWTLAAGAAAAPLFATPFAALVGVADQFLDLRQRTGLTDAGQEV